MATIADALALVAAAKQALDQAVHTELARRQALQDQVNSLGAQLAAAQAAASSQLQDDGTLAALADALNATVVSLSA